jgi:hypothetical protein
MLRLLFLIACICFFNVQGASISFDSSQEVYCQADNGGCAFNNVSIWINNTIPSTNDSVVIIGSGTFSSPLLVVLTEGYGVELKSLMVQTANVALFNASSLNAASLELGTSAFFSVLDGGLLQGTGYVSNLTISPTAKLHIHGTMSWYKPAALLLPI